MEGEIKFIMETTKMVPTWEGVVLNCPWFSNMRQEDAERGRYKEMALGSYRLWVAKQGHVWLRLAGTCQLLAKRSALG